MRAFSINPQTKKIEEIDIEMKANTVYSFFNSILIDEIETLTKHVIHADANALSENKTLFFLGEQLILGNALIIGKNGHEEADVTIPLKDLSEIINYDIPQFYSNTLSLLSSTDINIYRKFQVTQGKEKIDLSLEWVLYTFNIADERTKEYFLNELKKVLDSKDNVEKYIQKMAQLAINAAG